jgi:energy-coupling factor transporter ATP-binding protein EcfA2
MNKSGFYAIAYKSGSKPNSPYAGTVRPVIVESPDRVEEANPDDFPNSGDIFVIGGYDTSLKRFSESDLFRIPYRVNTQLGQDTGHRYYCGYVAHADDAEALERYEYLHLVDAAFDVDDRRLSFPYKPERLIVLRSPDGHLYGPFDYDTPLLSESEAYDIFLKPYGGLARAGVPDYHVLRFPAAFGTLEFGQQTLLLAEVKDILDCDYEAVDYLPEDQLLKIGNTLLGEDKKLGKQQLTSFRTALAEFTETNSQFDDQRRDRLLKLVDRLDYWTSQSSGLINDFLKTPEGQAKVQQHIQDNEADFLGMAERIAQKELGEPRKRLEGEIARLGQDKLRLEDDVRDLQVQAQKTQEELRKKQEAELTEAIAGLQAELDRRNDLARVKGEELDRLLASLKIAVAIEDLQKEGERWAQANERQQEDNRRLKAVGDKLIEEIKANDASHREKLLRVAVENKPYLDILNGIAPVFEESASRPLRAVRRREERPGAVELIEDVRCKLKTRYGRSCRFEDVANFLVSVDQNFLVVLAGLPGVGKTSLVTSLAGVLGVSAQDRFLMIPTARGFTSQRDVVGFYNPLSQKFQPAATGMYEVLRENQDPAQAAFPYWVLLDEANLSPMEHYFSSFLGMCDPEVPKEIKTGEPGQAGVLTVPDSMRFLATINYDNTTEPLSPRMIDRVPIIGIQPPDEMEAVRPSSPSPAEPLLSYGDLHAILQPAHAEDGSNGDAGNGYGGGDLTDEELRILAKIKEALGSSDPSRGVPTIISPRKTKAIRQYCAAARGLMRGKDGDGFALTALDYAVSQHILPLINGYGEKYRKRLEELHAAVRPLDRSRSLLDYILRAGDDEQKFYRYFS